MNNKNTKQIVIIPCKYARYNFYLKTRFFFENEQTGESHLYYGDRKTINKRKKAIEKDCYCKSLHDSFCDFCTGLRTPTSCKNESAK